MFKGVSKGVETKCLRDILETECLRDMSEIVCLRHDVSDIVKKIEKSSLNYILGQKNMLLLCTDKTKELI